MATPWCSLSPLSLPENNTVCPSTVLKCPAPAHFVSDSPHALMSSLSISLLMIDNLPIAFKPLTFHSPILILFLRFRRCVVESVAHLSTSIPTLAVDAADLFNLGDVRASMTFSFFRFIHALRGVCDHLSTPISCWP